MDINDIIISNFCLSDGAILKKTDNSAPHWISHPDGYKFCQISKKTIYFHRAVWVLNFGPIANGMEIDHIDNDTTNNSLSNLRVCDRSQNNQNTKLRKDNKSGAKGVFWDATSNSWRVSIWKNKKKHDGGRFLSLDDAKQAAHGIREHAHGMFANHGFKTEGIEQCL